MTEWEALLLIEQIKREEGERVQATLTHVKNSGKCLTALNLMLKPGQRAMRIVKVEEWESLKLAWREIT